MCVHTYVCRRQRSELYLVRYLLLHLIICAIDQPFVTFVHDSASVLAETSDKCTATRSMALSMIIILHNFEYFRVLSCGFKYSKLLPRGLERTKFNFACTRVHELISSDLKLFSSDLTIFSSMTKKFHVTRK